MALEKRTISILGSTGSIGYQALDVIDKIPHLFEINYLTINTKIELLEPQIAKYNPKGVVIQDEAKYKEFKQTTSFKGEILCGEEGLIHAASDKANDIILTALVGFAGVIPTFEALKNGIDIALANKETLVSAGEIITATAQKHNAKILAVDSEHSAILQCLAGEEYLDIEKIILTASGGPFRNLDKDKFKEITIKEALNHPNWSMGSKITIDSATMMNKGLEVIEAKWLFNLEPDRIEVLVHPQSIIHSMVQFNDGSVKAQLGLPDMKIPISHALTYPRHLDYNFGRMNLAEIGNLTFFKPDFDKFECLQLAFEAIKIGGTAPAVLNAANEIAVEYFLGGKIKFIEIPKLVEKALGSMKIIQKPTLDEIVSSDLSTREFVKSLININ